MTFAVTWLRCAADATGCAVVSGATGTTYALTAADVGARIRARVTAANATTEVAADSAVTAVVAAAPVVAPPAPAPAPATPKPAVAPAATATTTKPATSTTTKPATTTTTKTPAKTSTTSKATTSAKAKASAKATTSAKATAKAKTATHAPIAQLQRLRLTAAGVLRATLRCPRARPRACSTRLTIVAATASGGAAIAGTPLRFSVRVATLRRGATVTRSFALTDAQREALKQRATIELRVRLAAPASPKHVSEVFVHLSVPAGLAGTVSPK
jgi:hypothetical protein